MKKYFLLTFLYLIPFFFFAQVFKNNPHKIIITRDIYGVPHINAPTDADAVFGLIYAQCEDDFKRVELNYIEKLGRLSEIYGKDKLMEDLQNKILLDTNEAKQDFLNAPIWLKKLLYSFANGINYFLQKNPQVKPLLLHHFEPWYPLLWTDGSIGAINTASIDLADIALLYDDSINAQQLASLQIKSSQLKMEESGSNGFAISPKLTSTGNAMLYINPHTTLYYRPEVHIQSKEGLNAYGAVTWGQFFIYQGFNEYNGWMHTSSNVDVADVYIEKLEKINTHWFYNYNGIKKKIITKKYRINYVENNRIYAKKYSILFTQHGPILAKKNNQYLSLKSHNRDIKSLIQSWLRIKTTGFKSYKNIMSMCANTSNNTVFADKYGNIAYWHGNYIPTRNPTLNWSLPIDGTNPNLEWKGVHLLNETIHIYNPLNGWIQNCNSTPFTASGDNSPLQKNYPIYMAPDGENFRGLHAASLLKNSHNLNLDNLIQLGYNKTIPFFEKALPIFFARTKAYINTQKYISILPLYNQLLTWNCEADENSVPTTIAILWAESLNPIIKKVYRENGEKDQIENTIDYFNNIEPTELINKLFLVKNYLEENFSKWQVKWGDINRFQRINNDIPNKNWDSLLSYPMGYVSGIWGCLASFNSKANNNTKLRYGYSGNSFVCAVEFGKKIKAKSVLAGGNSGDKNNVHFNDQSIPYTKGQFKPIFFYLEDIEKNVYKKYRL